MSNNFGGHGGARTHITLLKRQVHQPILPQDHLCPRWDSNPQSRTLKGWCFTNSATRAFQKPIRGFNLLPITHRFLCCQPSYLESQRLSFMFVLFHTAKILFYFLSSTSVALFPWNGLFFPSIYAVKYIFCVSVMFSYHSSKYL